MKYLWILSLMAILSLAAVPKAVVFDWGNVIANELDRSHVVDFICKTFTLSPTEFELVNLEKRKAALSGKSDLDFWREYAKKIGVKLPSDWRDSYIAVIKASLGLDPHMITLVQELKHQKICVGLLSNISDRYAKIIRSYGFYEPFDPCLLSCEMGIEKPDTKAYECLLKTIKLPAHEIVFIDDRAENVDAAKKLGIDAFVFQSSCQVREELTQRGLFLTSVLDYDAQRVEKR